MQDPARAGLRPFTRVLIVLICLAPLSLAVPALMTDHPAIEEFDEGPEPAALAPLTARPPGGRLRVQDIRPIAGFAINAHAISDLNLYLESVDRIADLGANALIVLTPMMQSHVDSDRMEYRSDKCATDDQLAAIFQRARERGLHTTLLPIVLLEFPGEKDWRGVIRPGDWNLWWDAYDEFIDRFIDVANRSEVDLFIIGSELNSTEDMLDRWTRVARRVRERFHGQIGYSANWDRYDKIALWSLVDVMCVSSYFELLPDNESATVGELVQAWNPERGRLLRAARKWSKPMLVSEIGYPSVPWATAHPWNYVVKKGAEADHQAQARGWQAFFGAWSAVFQDVSSPALGFFGYHWSPYYHGDAWDCSYGIRGKPSHDIVKRGMARIRAAGDRLPASDAATQAPPQDD